MMILQESVSSWGIGVLLIAVPASRIGRLNI